LKVARAARFVAESAVQLHGAMGVTEELNVGAYVKRLMAIDRTFGTSAEHNERIAALRALRAAA
jgi:alkylation response protein AidB-like acyl-CoA dehydrogenase